MTYNNSIEQEQEWRESNNIAAYENKIDAQTDYRSREYRKMLDETRAKLEYCSLKLKEYEVSTSGANILQTGYQDGLNGIEPRLPYYGLYRQEWERGFIEYMKSGAFWDKKMDEYLAF